MGNEIIEFNKNEIRDVYSMLKQSDKGKVSQTIRNAEVVLENDRRFAGKIAYNLFESAIFLYGNVPWEDTYNIRKWSSMDDSRLLSILENDYGLRQQEKVFHALKNVASDNKYHPVRNLLESFKWDGKPHIENLLPDFLGAEKSAYNTAVMRLFMLGAIARVFQPGCKFDYMVIFTGKQGIGKSTFLKLLALNDDWFTDSIDSLDGDKAMQMLQGSWIVEFGELKALARTTSGVDGIKRFISATSDKFRLPYERRVDNFPRQSVFAGTTNRNEFLQDETGNRRFLVVDTGINSPTKNLFDKNVSIDEIKQAWAEAMHIFKSGEFSLVLPKEFAEEAAQKQENSMMEDTRIGVIKEYLDKLEVDRVCILELWEKALGEQKKPARWQSNELASIMANMNDWEKMSGAKKFGAYGAQKGYQRKKQNKIITEDKDGFIQLNENYQEELPFM